MGTGQKLRAEGFLLTCRLHSDSFQRMGGLSARFPSDRRELPSALLRFGAVRLASLLKFCRTDPAGFIVRISGDAPQISAELEDALILFYFFLFVCRTIEPWPLSHLQGGL